MEPQAELTLETLKTHRFDIEIPNFEKWNPEPKGGKPRHWFKIDSYIADDPKIRELTAFQFVFYITLLAYRARSKPAGWCSDGTRDGSGGRAGSLLRDLRLSLVPFPSGFRGGAAGVRAILKLSNLKLIEITNVRPRLEEKRLEEKRREPQKTKTMPVQPAAVVHGEQIPLIPVVEIMHRKQEPKGSPPQMPFLIATYIDSWKKRYRAKEARPDTGGMALGALKRVLQQYPAEHVALLLQTYCQIDDKWFNTKCHDLVTFQHSLGQISLCLEKGRSNPTERTWQDIVDEKEGAQKVLGV